jgi:hypothetical protein
MATTNVCEDCHTNVAFAPVARVDHLQVLGACASCHDGATAMGKDAGHIASGDTCDNCHTTGGWTPANFEHDNVTAGCASCHNGVDSLGRPATHISTTNVCEDCHSVVAFAPVIRVDHAQVVGTCSGCHDGTTAVGKHAAHLPTTGECSTCHSTDAFVPSQFDHGNVAAGTCAGCHNGSTSTGKPADHFTTDMSCDTCHTRDVWTPLSFRHGSANYPGDHGARLACGDCHTSNAEALPWPFPAYAPDCAGCHASDYRPEPHRNAPVSQLRDCSGACHQASPEHSVSGREW